MKTILFIAGVLLVTGCSNRQLYYALQNARENECRQRSSASQQQCLDQARKSYNQYQAQRDR